MMTKKSVFVLCCILLVQIAPSVPLWGNTNEKQEVSNSKRCRVYVQWMRKKVQKRSIQPIASGYIEEGQLHILFNIPVDDKYIEVTDHLTETIIYRGTTSGTSLVIPVISESEDYDVNIIEE